MKVKPDTITVEKHMSVEYCFGILKKRFPCLNIPLRTKLQNSIAIIISCFVLHYIDLLKNDNWDYNEIQNVNQEDGAKAFTRNSQEIFLE